MNPDLRTMIFIITTLLLSLGVGIIGGHLAKGRPHNFVDTQVYVAECVDDYGEVYKINYVSDKVRRDVEVNLCELYKPKVNEAFK